ncbi:MAG: amidohydrolase family protein [Candidatus Daviesbacteria bacterium]|nr:amidohydrolase family protein [Candidatus Daviesbacteria bacterium]
MIIDSHVHLSIYEGQAISLQKALDKLLEEMKKNNVEQAIIIPDNIENDPKIADLDTAISLIKGKSNLFLLGSPQIIQRGSSEVEKYKKLFVEGKIKGIKFFPGHDPYYPIDERCLPYFEICQNLNIPVVFHTGENSNNPELSKYNDPKYIVEVAKKYSNLKVVITHYYWPKIEYCYEITKNTPNIYFELAGTADEEVLEKSGGIEKMKEVLLKTIADRPDQVIFGTDYPMCKIESHIELVKSLNLSQDEKNKIFSTNAIKLYKLPKLL